MRDSGGEEEGGGTFWGPMSVPFQLYMLMSSCETRPYETLPSPPRPFGMVTVRSNVPSSVRTLPLRPPIAVALAV